MRIRRAPWLAPWRERSTGRLRYPIGGWRPCRVANTLRAWHGASWLSPKSSDGRSKFVQPCVSVLRDFPNEAGQPISRALLRFTGEDAERRRDRVVDRLRLGSPSVEVMPAGTAGI